MVRREKSNYVIQSVSHALDVLEQFHGNVDEIGVTELSKRLKLHKNNVFDFSRPSKPAAISNRIRSRKTIVWVCVACSWARLSFIKWAYCCNRARFLRNCPKRPKKALTSRFEKGVRSFPSISSSRHARCGSCRFWVRCCRPTARRRGKCIWCSKRRGRRAESS